MQVSLDEISRVMAGAGIDMKSVNEVRAKAKLPPICFTEAGLVPLCTLPLSTRFSMWLSECRRTLIELTGW